MKYVHIIVINQDCETVTAQALVFNCTNLEFNEQIEYPIDATVEQIYDIIDPNNAGAYSVTFDHVGGRPNDR